MTTEDFAMLVIGQIIAAGMFAGGMLVGCSLRRKDASHDDCDKATEEDRWIKYQDSIR